jgi:hypothetical protein
LTGMIGISWYLMNSEERTKSAFGAAIAPCLFVDFGP